MFDPSDNSYLQNSEFHRAMHFPNVKKKHSSGDFYRTLVFKDARARIYTADAKDEL